MIELPWYVPSGLGEMITEAKSHVLLIRSLCTLRIPQQYYEIHVSSGELMGSLSLVVAFWDRRGPYIKH